MKSTGIFTAQFRHRSYDELEQAQLRNAIGDGYVVNLQPQQIPEAGGSTEIWMFLQSPSGWIVTTVLSGIAYDGLKSLGKRLYDWSTTYQRRNAFGSGPEIVRFTIELDGVKFHFVDGRHEESPDSYFMTPQHLDVLHEIVQRTLTLLPLTSLHERKFKEVIVPVFASSSTDWFHGQYWTLTGETARDQLYNSASGTFGPAPTEPLAISTGEESSGPG
jgi:hypothetical protein